MVVALALPGPASDLDPDATPGASLSTEECVEEVGADGECVVAPAEVAKPVTEPTVATAVEGDTLVFFWGVSCPHCERAKPFLEELVAARPELRCEWVEVRHDPAGRGRFVATMQALGAQAVSVPAFVRGGRYLVGFPAEGGEEAVRALLADEVTAPAPVSLPLFGEVDPGRVPFVAFTLLIGLADGFNPCAMWVLVVLLGILVHVRSRRRLLLFGGAFVAVSGIVYFLFMVAWASLFQLVGLSRPLSAVLGAVVLAMGLINLKEIVWFRRGPSLMIPDRVKPGLYARMRGIAGASRLPTALAGITVLAFVVNLVELGCTLGLPAVYTRLLSMRPELGAAGRLGYLGLYNLAYVVPLAVIVVVYAWTFHRMTLSERAAKLLKGVSGVLLVGFGALLLFAPGWLSFGS